MGTNPPIANKRLVYEQVTGPAPRMMLGATKSIEDNDQTVLSTTHGPILSKLVAACQGQSRSL